MKCKSCGRIFSGVLAAGFFWCECGQLVEAAHEPAHKPAMVWRAEVTEQFHGPESPIEPAPLESAGTLATSGTTTTTPAPDTGSSRFWRWNPETSRWDFEPPNMAD